MSLISSLGFAYCNDFFSGALVTVNKTPCIWQRVDDDGVVELTDISNPRRIQALRVDHGHFKSFSSFEVPPLGYRYAPEYNTLLYALKIPSVRRGVHARDVRIMVHDATEELARVLPVDKSYIMLVDDHLVKAKSLLVPTYLPLKEGLRQILDGTIPFFACSPEFAVAPSADADLLEILYRTRRVGTIDPNGKINLNISNTFTNYLWEKEISRG